MLPHAANFLALLLRISYFLLHVMSQSLRRSLTVFVLLVAIIGIALYSSSDVRDWFGVTFISSKVVDGRPVSHFDLPLPDSTEPLIRFLAVGDAGTGRFGQQQVADAMAGYAARSPLSFVLFLGDNFYEFGVKSIDDEQWRTKFESVYTAPSLQIPFYAVLGNHDYRGNPQAQVEYTIHNTRWRMPARYYTFSRTANDSTTVQFFCLDTQPMAYLRASDLESGKDTGSYMPQLRWLKQELSASQARWRIAAGHHPVYSNGFHGNNAVLGSLLEPLFDAYNVNFYLCGHDHDLQLLRPVNDVHYVVSGGGGKHRDVKWQENTIYAATNLGFTSFMITQIEVVLEFLNKDGQIGYVHRFPVVDPSASLSKPK